MLGKKSLKTLFAILFLATSTITNANDTTPVNTKYLSNVPQYISYEKGQGAFCIAENGITANICVSSSDYEGVRRAAADLLTSSTCHPKIISKQ